MSQLTGFPFPVGGSSIWKVRPGHAPTVFTTGFTNVADIAAGRDGSLYVVEIAKGGLLAASAPGAIAVARDGSIYVTNVSVAAGAGQVLRVTP